MEDLAASIMSISHSAPLYLFFDVPAWEDYCLHEDISGGLELAAAGAKSVADDNDSAEPRPCARQLLPLKLPPRLQHPADWSAASSAATSPTPQAQLCMVPSWSPFASSTRHRDFDPFAAALDKVRRDGAAALPSRPIRRARSLSHSRLRGAQATATSLNISRLAKKASRRGVKRLLCWAPTASSAAAPAPRKDGSLLPKPTSLLVSLPDSHSHSHPHPPRRRRRRLGRNEGSPHRRLPPPSHASAPSVYRGKEGSDRRFPNLRPLPRDSPPHPQPQPPAASPTSGDLLSHRTPPSPSFILLRCCLKTPWRPLKLCRADERCGDELGWEARAPRTIWVTRDHGCSHPPSSNHRRDRGDPDAMDKQPRFDPLHPPPRLDFICFPCCNVAYLNSIQAAATALEMQDELLARATPSHLHGRHPQATKMTTRSPATAAATTTSPSPRFALQDD